MKNAVWRGGTVWKERVPVENRLVWKDAWVIFERGLLKQEMVVETR